MVDDATEKVIDAAADAAGEMADSAEHLETAIRSLSRIKVQYALLGAAAGATVGALTSWYIAYRRAERKYTQFADEEIAAMHDNYRKKVVAAEAAAAKKPVEDIVRARGYSSSEAKTTEGPPMAVQPPQGVAEDDEDDDDSAMAADEVEGPDGVRDIPPGAIIGQGGKIILPMTEEDRKVLYPDPVDHEWNYHEELRRRSPDIPYVIHYDERHEMDGYGEETLTYYEKDDVLCDERDQVKELTLIGEGNLERFGHGSPDPVIMYVRNDSVEMVYEVIRSRQAYAEEVHGFTHTGYSGNLERMRTRERYEQDDED